MSDLGKLFVLIGVIIVVLGAVLSLVGRLPGIGRLPGDIVVEREHFRLYLPLTTCLVVSVVLSLIVWILRR